MAAALPLQELSARWSAPRLAQALQLGAAGGERSVAAGGQVQQQQQQVDGEEVDELGSWEEEGEEEEEGSRQGGAAERALGLLKQQLAGLHAGQGERALA